MRVLQLREALILLQLIAIKSDAACRELLHKQCDCRYSWALMADREMAGPVRFRMYLGDKESSSVPFNTEFLRLFFALQAGASKLFQIRS